MCLDVSLITTNQSFYEIKEDWNELLKSSDNNTFFLRWEWLYYWWQAYNHSDCRLFIIIVKENDKIIGIAPFYIKRKRFIYKELNFLGSNIVCSDHLDFIFDRETGDKALFLILSFLKKNSSQWDILYLTDIPSVSQNINSIESFFNNYYKIINRRYSVCPYIDLNMPWDNVTSHFSSKLKNTIKRKTNKLIKNHDFSFVEVGSKENFNFFFHEFIKLNKLSLAARGVKSPFYRKDFTNFHKQLIVYLLKDKGVKFYFLTQDNKVVAGIYILVANRKYYYYQSGYNPLFKKDSLGTLLMHHSIKSAYEESIIEFDMLRGDESYKYNWTKNCRTNCSILVFNNTASAFVYSKFYLLFKILKPISKKLFDPIYMLIQKLNPRNT